MAIAGTVDLEAQNAALQAQIDQIKRDFAAMLAKSAADAGRRGCSAYVGPRGKVPGEPGVGWCENPLGAGHPDDHVFNIRPSANLVVTS